MCDVAGSLVMIGVVVHHALESMNAFQIAAHDTSGGHGTPCLGFMQCVR